MAVGGRLRLIRLGLAAAMLAAAAPWASAAALPRLTADTACGWGAANCNPPVRDVLDQFRSLRDHGDVFGFGMGDAPDVSMDHHWQGVQRLMAGQGRYLAVSRSGAHVSFVVVDMASRNRSGERLRSNRLGTNTALIAPPPKDHVVAIRHYTHSEAGFAHSGGMQAAGRYLAVGLERGARSRVAFWDLRTPASPVRVGTLTHATGVAGAGTVSLARLAGGRHLLIVGGTDANTLDFYISRPGSRLAAPAFAYAVTWRESQLRTELGHDREFGNYQNLALVADTRDTLFLIGTHTNGKDGAGSDFADLFRLENDPADGVRITKVAKRHLYCAIPTATIQSAGQTLYYGGRQCNFDAAGGVYVTPSNGLLLYSTEHDNDGIGGSVKAEEFRPDPHRQTCDALRDAWVELYEDDHYNGGRSVMIDYPDRHARDYENYDHVDDFEDKASAATWCLPRGRRYRLYRDKQPCRAPLDLLGTGSVVRDPDFGDNSGSVRHFGDTVSCSRWLTP